MKTLYSDRRNFIKNLGLTSLSTSTLTLPRFGNTDSFYKKDSNINHIGPIEDFSPQIGTLVSMLDWLSNSVINATKKLTIEQLDYFHDKNSNSIGSLMLHIVATEVLYQDLTFHNLQDFSPANKLKWNVAMELGVDAQSNIKGNNLEYYVEAMNEVRNRTKSEMKKRDDTWFLGGETKEWNWNNYCKWFHVAEHFANHRGQMTWYEKRLPKK